MESRWSLHGVQVESRWSPGGSVGECQIQELTDDAMCSTVEFEHNRVPLCGVDNGGVESYTFLSVTKWW
jgi:hypothetical protein